MCSVQILQTVRCVCLTALCFGMAAATPVRAADEQYESWMAKGQSTYIWQQKPGFGAAYSGQNSLSAAREKSYTFTATGYFGARPWNGGEVYFNPEVTQGSAFSNLSGLAGFTNGELTKVSGSNPTFYRQRLFLRQTWNLGGGREQIESDLNQMAGMVDKNRLVLTVGNFSVLDVFDDNTYAKDPRSQFMNWDNWSYAAFDYAADSRGYGWGFAAEWYKDDWVLRFGRMTGPREPNGLPLDYQLGRHYGDQVELERAYSLGERPGKIRILAWRNRAILASYNDALTYGLTNPGDPNHQWITKVRTGEKIKYGYGVNVEQSVAKYAGVFLRAMKADGRTETYAFTEADASLSAGLSVNGGAWGRGKDTAGIALARNMLSPDRRNYLAAGGISFFIGDGALNYRGENLFEIYYNLNIWKAVGLSLDYQHVQNPAYNADRGPVNFFAARLHAEF